MATATKTVMKDRLVLLGICSDENSSYLRGTAEAPALIRSALYSKSANLTSETGISLSSTPRFIDRGDIIVKNGIQSFMDIERQVSEVINDGALPLVLGGDHAITYPIFRAVSHRYGKMSILHFDVGETETRDHTGSWCTTYIPTGDRSYTTMLVVRECPLSLNDNTDNEAPKNQTDVRSAGNSGIPASRLVMPH